MNLTKNEISKLLEDKVGELSAEERDEILVAVVGTGLAGADERRVRSDLLKLVFGNDTEAFRLDPEYDGALLASLRTRLSEDPDPVFRAAVFNTLVHFRERRKQASRLRGQYYGGVWDGEIGTA